jgi:hypothetical protein
MNEKCRPCPLLFCDFVSQDCRLTAGEVARLRPDMMGRTISIELGKAYLTHRFSRRNGHSNGQRRPSEWQNTTAAEKARGVTGGRRQTLCK